MARSRLPADERRRQIAEAALQILAERGAHRLTAQEIASAVGVTDGTLFRHFKNKDEIVDAAIAFFEELLGGDLPPATLPALERLEAFFVRRLAKVRARPEVMRLAFSDRLEEVAGPRGAERVRQVTGRSFGFVRSCLEDARAQGLIADDVPLEHLVWIVTGVLRGAALAGARGGERLPAPEDIWRPLEELLLRSKRPTAPRPQVPPTKRRRSRS